MQEDNLYKIRHSLAHVMAQAVLQIRPNARLAFGPPVDNGFYYDFEFAEAIAPEDFKDIEKRMKKIIRQRQEFSESSKNLDDAIKFFDETDQVFKSEYAKELIEKGEDSLGFYTNGSFIDMCKGPHVAHTGELPEGGFCIDKVAGAYWRGDETRPQLTRLYALAFETREELAEYKKMRKLAMERDHRKLSKDLELFIIDDKIGPGLPLWLPNGAIIRDELQKFATEVEFQSGYQQVHTPHITKENLYYQSGHLPYYEEGMFPPMEIDGHKYYLKPMNCPHHHKIYSFRPRSYRELPLRLAEYGTCYRYEDSGALSGLLRVRMLNMNDAHIYCTPEQLKEEFIAVLDLHRMYYEKFRLTDFWMRLSTHDPKNSKKYVENSEAWKYSENVVREVLESSGINFEVGEGEAAFYGPKVDFQIKNVIGREETASTNQLDFAMPQKFDLSYIDKDSSQARPYIIHRAPLGTHERFIAFLIEHFGGAFPTWMSPKQVAIIPVANKYEAYANEISEKLTKLFVRSEVIDGTDSLNKKVRNTVTRKIPNILIVGEDEEESNSVTWRRYCTKNQETLSVDKFIETITEMIKNRSMDNFEDEKI